MNRKEARRLNRCKTQLATIGDLPKVSSPKGVVLISALMGDAIRARGKVEPHLFFPGFCMRLAARGYQSEFVFHADELIEKSAKHRCCIIHMYNEERKVPDNGLIDEANSYAELVFNNVDTGKIIGNKSETNEYLIRHNIQMPSTHFADTDAVFSNEVDRTSKSAFLMHGTEVDKVRYNTRFIDTRAKFEGEKYYTTIRLLTVGSEVIFAFIGARNARAENPTVHGVDTPVNGPLIQHFYETLYLANRDRLHDLAVHLNKALGLGFYHHDIIIEKGTREIYLCEVGYKFDAYAYGSRLDLLMDHTSCLKPLIGDTYASRSADALIHLWENKT